MTTTRDDIQINIEPAGYFGTAEEQSGHKEPADPSKIIVVSTSHESRSQSVTAFQEDHDSLGAIADIVPASLHHFVENSISEAIKREAFTDKAREVNQAKSLDQLLAALLAAEQVAVDHEAKLTDFVDTADLPTFGTFAGDTSEIFSWDDERFLVQGNPWHLIDRS
tara:strand:+ start:84 stop:581 length:498 start_codon:yes stop_codon:yes gene_type:complete